MEAETNKLFVWQKEWLFFKSTYTSSYDGTEYLCGFPLFLFILIWSLIPILNFCLLNELYKCGKKDRDKENKNNNIKIGFWEGIFYRYVKIYVNKEK